MAVDLVNSLDVVSGEEALQVPADVAAFIDSHDGDWCRPGWEPEDRDLHEVRALRSRLRQVFDAETDAGAAAVLNGLLADMGAVPRVSVHGAAPHLHFESEADSPARYLGAITAMGLSVALIEGGFDRFGICHSSTCEDVFVDVSRNHSRLHCSDKCTTRENVAAHRARLRAG
ncbi:MAG TPA: CGNR zinc finger domain-containing protein [Acidimicrobiia bacterium]|nr:CGNR zinc finger domain-containing protein [Acidimicrobiia bacterium]